MKKYYALEVNATTQKMMKRIEKFREFLADNNIRFETSGAFENIHFEILLDESEFKTVDKAIGRILYFDAICEN